MVYVWGSNSSHQLAEGTLEKILLPKLTQGFSDAQMVRLPTRSAVKYLHVYRFAWNKKKIFCVLNVLLDWGRTVLYVLSICRWFSESLWERQLWPSGPGRLQQPVHAQKTCAGATQEHEEGVLLQGLWWSHSGHYCRGRGKSVCCLLCLFVYLIIIL